MTRKQLESKIKKNNSKIAELRASNKELRRQYMLLSDKDQQFVEQEEQVLTCGRPKKYEKRLVGRINWTDKFTDEDTGQTILIERSRIIRINGEWIDGL